MFKIKSWKIKSWKKKILATCAAAALSVSLTFGTPAKVEAVSAVDLIGAGIQITAEATTLNAQINAGIKHYNETEEGSQELYQGFREKYGVNNDSYYNAMLDRIMANLTNGVAAIDPSIREKPYKYFISNDETLNAGCAMGHVMMVNIGTFRQITNEDEIAAIVGHEMGHGQKNHVAQSNKKHLQKAVTASIAGTAIGASVGGGALTSIITSVALNHSVAHGDRKHETEAEQLRRKYEQMISDADEEIQRQKAEASEELEAEKRLQLDQARAEARKIISTASKTAEIRSQKVLQDAHEEVRAMAVEMVEKLVMESGGEALDAFLDAAERKQADNG